MIGGNVDPDRIVPCIYTAQSKYIQPLLGTVLYNKLQQDIESNSLVNQYETLVNDYIQDTLVHYSVCEYLPYSLYHIAQAGVLKYNPDNLVSPDKRDVDFILQKSLQTAQFFAERLSDYLIANSNIFPEYWETTGKSDSIYPDKGQHYSTGWVL
jgi:hypothetical protein